MGTWMVLKNLWLSHVLCSKPNHVASLATWIYVFQGPYLTNEPWGASGETYFSSGRHRTLARNKKGNTNLEESVHKKERGPQNWHKRTYIAVYSRQIRPFMVVFTKHWQNSDVLNLTNNYWMLTDFFGGYVLPVNKTKDWLKRKWFRIEFGQWICQSSPHNLCSWWEFGWTSIEQVKPWWDKRVSERGRKRVPKRKTTKGTKGKKLLAPLLLGRKLIGRGPFTDIDHDSDDPDHVSGGTKPVWVC